MKAGPWLLFKLDLFRVERWDLSKEALLRVDRFSAAGFLIL